jgi:hypothetical protein
VDWLDLPTILWQLLGLVLSTILGRQGLLITYKERRMALDAGLDWPWESVRSIAFAPYSIGIALAGLVIIFAFSWWIFLIGFIAGVPAGYLLRRVWKIDDTPPGEEPDETYHGD